MNLHEYQHIIEQPSFYDGQSSHPIHKMLKIPIYIVKIAHLIGTREQKDLIKNNQKHLIRFDEREKKMFTILQIMAHNYMHKMNLQRSFSLQKYELSPNLLLPYSSPSKEVEFIDNTIPFMSESMILAEKIISEGKKKKKKPKKKGTQMKTSVEEVVKVEDEIFDIDPVNDEEKEFTHIEIESSPDSDPFLVENENYNTNQESPPQEQFDEPDQNENINDGPEGQPLEFSEEDSDDHIDQTDEVSSKSSETHSQPSDLYGEFTNKLKFISLSTKKVQTILENPNLPFVDQLVSICEEYENLLVDMRENYDSIIQTTNLKLYIKETQLEKLQERLSNYEAITPLSKELNEDEYDIANNVDDSLNYSYQYEYQGEAEDSFVVHKGEESFFR